MNRATHRLSSPARPLMFAICFYRHQVPYVVLGCRDIVHKLIARFCFEYLMTNSKFGNLVAHLVVRAFGVLCGVDLLVACKRSIEI